jgi:two-component system alkaline phosphatase synthesis response regulator PhoP
MQEQTMSQEPYKILTIDDDPDILEALRTVLEAKGYEVIQADSAEEGLKALKATQPDLVIVDLMMEEVDAGTSFVTRVRALGGKRIPIYMLSSVGDELSKNVPYQGLGLSGVFQKPIQPQTLLNVIEQALD